MKLIFTLGTVLALDEMMIRFMGRSNETHRIKNKPIKKGYKFFVLATLFGFVVSFTPDGRSASKSNRKLDYDSKNKEFEKVGSMILFLLSSISELVQKKSKRIHVQDTRRKTWSSNENDNNKDEEKQTNFKIAMDNFFTLPRVIKTRRDKGIGIVSTAKYQRA